MASIATTIIIIPTYQGCSPYSSQSATGHDEVCGVLGDVNIDVPVTSQQLRHTVGQVGAGV